VDETYVKGGGQWKYFEHGLIGLMHLRQWAAAWVFQSHISVEEVAARAVGYDPLLKLNVDSIPD
jgi:hypothetical protein